ncbi:MAG: hypothetical protein ACK52J_01605 [bacterium]|jgi:hypothetical protein
MKESDFVKSENFYGKDLEERKNIFNEIFPEETFIDRRIHVSGISINKNLLILRVEVN